MATSCLAIAVLARAAEPAAGGEEAQIRAASAAYMAALGRGDVKAVIDAWTPQGRFVDSAGEAHLAREMASREFPAEGHVSEGQEFPIRPTTIRLATPQVAIEESTLGDEGAASSFLAIWVKQDQRWLLDYLREISGPAAPPQNPLEELNWLVGEWQTEGEGPVAKIETKWTDDKRFLLQEFEVESTGEQPFRVEQRIGWDASRNQIRSWLFRSDGGFEEGTWSRTGDVWVVEKLGVLPDGEKTSTVNFWSHEPPNRCWFKILDARVGDRKLDDVIIRMSRAATR